MDYRTLKQSNDITITKMGILANSETEENVLSWTMQHGRLFLHQQGYILTTT